MTEVGAATTRNLPPIGRILGGVAILTMTLLTFASCGMMEFKGHNLLRNRINAEDTMSGLPVQGLLDMDPSRLNERGELGGAPSADASNSKPMFEGGDQWLHFVYLAAFAMAVLALFVTARAHLVIGVAGLVLIAVFMFGFDNMFQQKMGDSSPSGRESTLDTGGLRPSLSFEAGAWLTLFAFAGMGAFGWYARKVGESG